MRALAQDVNLYDQISNLLKCRMSVRSHDIISIRFKKLIVSILHRVFSIYNFEIELFNQVIVRV